jgi:DNA-binding transcriptional ArsR family regulator
MEEEVMIVDRGILKLLAADTRMDVLKELKSGNKTLSDLSKILNKDKSTLIEHLEKLTNAGLVKRIERPGRKWIFYTLTKKR